MADAVEQLAKKRHQEFWPSITWETGASEETKEVYRREARERLDHVVAFLSDEEAIDKLEETLRSTFPDHEVFGDVDLELTISAVKSWVVDRLAVTADA